MNVGVLRGGIGHEYDISLETGKTVLANLPSSYRPRDILVTKDGTWHLDGLPIYPQQVGKHVEVVVNALHGHYGEDGQVQRLLDNVHVPYTGSGHFASSIAFNKPAAKKILADSGLFVPRSEIITLNDLIEDKARSIFNSFCPPWVVKPANSGSSVGVTLARSISELIQAIESAFHYSDTILIEEYIRGREVTCGIIENYRDKEHYTLLPVEVRKPHLTVFGQDHKYGEEGRLVCPSCLRPMENENAQESAKSAYRALGLRHYATIDCVVTPSKVYILEANTLPGLLPNSPFSHGLRSVGSSHSDFLDHVIKRALVRK